MEHLAFGIGDMRSGACAANIEKRLYGVAGVQSAVVSFAQQAAEIVYDPAQTDAATLANAVAEAGYAACLSGAVAAPGAAEHSATVNKSHTNSGCG